MENQAEYSAETEEALEVLGTGYNNPSVEIEPARTVIERRGQEFKEVERAAFVKISTSFKGELVSMSDAALKVWIFIALSVNRKTGLANPGLRTIATALGKGVNTIRECLIELESLGLLLVDRESKKYNIYEPINYVSANRSDVSEPDTIAKTVSEKVKTVSENLKSVSASQTLNQRNQSKPDIQQNISFNESASDLSWSLLGDKPITEKQLSKQQAKIDFENMIDKQLTRLGLNFSQFVEDDKDRFRKFVAEEHKRGRELSTFVDWWLADDFRKIALPWKLDPIRQQWLKAFVKPETEDHPEFKPFVPEAVNAVPNPIRT